MFLKRIHSRDVPRLWLGLRECLRIFSPNFLDNHSSFSVCFRRGKILLYMVGSFIHTRMAKFGYNCSVPMTTNLMICPGPWKRKNLAEYGIVTQCIAPTRVNDQYLTNVLLKINAKVICCFGYFLSCAQLGCLYLLSAIGFWSDLLISYSLED